MTLAEQQETPRISIDELKKLIDAKSDVIILDARRRMHMIRSTSKGRYRYRGKQR